MVEDGRAIENIPVNSLRPGAPCGWPAGFDQAEKIHERSSRDFTPACLGTGLALAGLAAAQPAAAKLMNERDFVYRRI